MESDFERIASPAPAEIASWFRFIDWVMFLLEKEDDMFWDQVSVFEKEGKMPYITVTPVP
ncbi:hypothetical protein [Desulfonema magnum]|uniref:hypothetical protein n=1 Tax=Desulfonema magnum TaxID=45655 RepID=UPI001A9B5FC5|nr:hypothetical protein [Desulfonema magnum]